MMNFCGTLTRYLRWHVIIYAVLKVFKVYAFVGYHPFGLCTAHIKAAIHPITVHPKKTLRIIIPLDPFVLHPAIEGMKYNTANTKIQSASIILMLLYYHVFLTLHYKPRHFVHNHIYQTMNKSSFHQVSHIIPQIALF